MRELTATPVVVGEVARRRLEPVEAVSGYLQPVRKVALQFQVPGRVETRLVEPGVQVEKDQLLLELEAGDYRDAVTQARAEWQQEKENLARDRRLLELAIRSRKLQEKEVERLNSLSARSLASKTLIGEAEALLASRRAEEARLRASVDTAPQRIAVRRAARDRAERNLARTRLRAPFAGVVNEVMFNRGDYASQTGTAVELVDQRLDFYAQVRGDVARSLRLQDEVPVQVGNDERLARVVAVQPDPDPRTFTHAVRLRMPVEETRSGMAARAVLPLRPLDDVLVVPVTAILQEDGAAFVFTVVDKHLRRVPVSLGARVASLRVVARGLTAGEQIVIRDVAALADGQPVVIDGQAS